MRAVVVLFVVLCFVGAFAANLDHMRRLRQVGQKPADATKGTKADKPADGQKPKDAAANDSELDALTVVSCFAEQIAAKKESSKKGQDATSATSKKATKNSDDDDDGGDGFDDDDSFLQLFAPANITRGEFAKQIGNPKEFCAKQGKGTAPAQKPKDAANKKDAAKEKAAAFLEEDPAEVDEDVSSPKDGLNKKQKDKAKGGDAADKPKDAAADKPKDAAAAADKPAANDKPKDGDKVKGAKRFCAWYNKNAAGLGAKCAKYKNDQQPSAPLFAGSQDATSKDAAAPKDAAPTTKDAAPTTKDAAPATKTAKA